MLDIASIAKLGGARKYNIDETIFYAGDSGHEMFIILKGKVGVLINSIDGFPIKVAELGPGDFFGEMSLLEGMPRSATVEALEDCIVMVINENNFEKIIAQQPNLAYRIMKGMSGRLRKQNEEISQLKHGEAAESQASEVNSSVKILDDSIFPPNHKTYPLTASPDDEAFLFDREVTCPVCEKTFTVKSVRSSKLRLDKVDNDMRQRFIDIEPLWYLVWVCPHCYYSNFNFEFKQVSDSMARKFLDQSTELKDKVKLQFSNPRKIDEVFASYYLMLQYLRMSTQDPSAGAKVWLRLSWLYYDVQDEEMFIYASQQAYDMFKDSYYNGRRSTTVEQEQRLSLLLGELSLRLGENEEALKFFRGALVRKADGNNTVNRQAEDRIAQLREANKT